MASIIPHISNNLFYSYLIKPSHVQSSHSQYDLLSHILSLLHLFAMSFTSIPILDLSQAQDIETKSAFLDDLRHALMEVGFFYISNTGLEDSLIQDVITQGKLFFDLPDSKKLKVQMKNAASFLGKNKLPAPLSSKPPNVLKTDSPSQATISSATKSPAMPPTGANSSTSQPRIPFPLRTPPCTTTSSPPTNGPPQPSFPPSAPSTNLTSAALLSSPPPSRASSPKLSICLLRLSRDSSTPISSTSSRLLNTRIWTSLVCPGRWKRKEWARIRIVC